MYHSISGLSIDFCQIAENTALCHGFDKKIGDIVGAKQIDNAREPML